MPQTHVVQRKKDEIFMVKRQNGQDRRARILERKDGQVHVQFTDLSRIDEWIPEENVLGNVAHLDAADGDEFLQGSSTGATMANEDIEEIIMTEEEFDLQAHKEANLKRNFDYIFIGNYQVKPWYRSPYPPEDGDAETNGVDSPAPSGKARSSRSHNPVLDTFTGRADKLNPPSLWLCEYCLTFTDVKNIQKQELHKRNCKARGPPGRVVYQRGTQTIYEVDAAEHKTYCTKLALLGKLFLETKTVHFEIGTFYFYVLTDASTSRTNPIMGYFTKEKQSFENNNLGTIVTLPQHQRKGYGMLMIEFSYELSRRAGVIQGPEGPLSDLGLRSYLAYWVATIIRFLRRVLHAGNPPPLPTSNDDFIPGKRPGVVKYRATNGIFEFNVDPKKSKKRRADSGDFLIDDTVPLTEPRFTTHRHLVVEDDPDGMMGLHVTVQCTLSDLSRATNLRPTECVFAMNQIGLIPGAIRVPLPPSSQEDGSVVYMDLDLPVGGLSKEDESGRPTLVITKEMVNKLAWEHKVKRPIIDLASVKVPERIVANGPGGSSPTPPQQDKTSEQEPEQLEYPP